MPDSNLIAWLELCVMVFQVVGVAAVCLSRLLTSQRWARRGRIAFVVVLIVLGTTGALCGRHDSEFALFAGGTMTVLLIGMTIGSTPTGSTLTDHPRIVGEANLAP